MVTIKAGDAEIIWILAQAQALCYKFKISKPNQRYMVEVTPLSDYTIFLPFELVFILLGDH